MDTIISPVWNHGSQRLCRDYLSPLFACCSRSIWLPFSYSEYLDSQSFFSKHTFRAATEQTGACNTVPHDCRNRWRKTEIAGMICAHFGKGCISAGCLHDKVRVRCEPRATGAAVQGEGMSVARDLRDGYDDSCRWLLQEGLMLCLFENLTGTEIAAVQTEAKSGMIFGEKSNNWFMSSEKASHSLATSPV